MTTATDQRQLALAASREMENASATEILQWAYTEFGNRLVVTSSLADTVMIHLAEQVAPGIDVIFLDTGYHFAETLSTRDAVAAVHNVNLISLTPDHTPAEQDAIWGKDLFATNPDLCCAMRKTQPLDHALTNYSAWASGVRRADYIEQNSLMVNPLLDDGYLSIGCSPCTARPLPGDPRSGRWAGLAKTECGIHL